MASILRACAHHNSAFITSISSILGSFLRTCLDNVVQPHFDATCGCEESAKVTAEDIGHQSDLILRRLVKSHISAVQTGECKQALAEKCQG